MPLTFLPGEAIDNYIALPLKSVHTILGVIEVFNVPEPANAQQQADLLLEIAGPASLALTNGMLYRSAQHEIAEQERAKAYLQESQEQLLSNDAMLAQQARQLEGVAQISAAASTIQDVHQLLQIAVDLTKSYLNLYGK